MSNGSLIIWALRIPVAFGRLASWRMTV